MSYISTPESAASPRTIDPRSITISKSPAPDFLAAALHWYHFGLDVIPIVPGDKKTAVKWDPWLADLSKLKITNYWRRHPDHEVGFIVGDGIIVFDADTPQSLSRLCDIEHAFDVSPALTVKTSKGEHHYFKLATGTHAKSNSHSTEKYPERIDVKTGRALVVLPPSGGKEVLIDEASQCSHLAAVEQLFIDAVAGNNGREPQRPQPAARSNRPPTVFPDIGLSKLAALLEPLDPDMGYEDWVRTGMALHHATNGSEAGLLVFDDWSMQGTKYPGFSAIEYKWRTFRNHCERPVTIATILWMLTEQGHDIADFQARSYSQFEACEFTVIEDDDREAQND